MPDVRIGITATFTVDPVIPLLGAAVLEAGYAQPQIGNAEYDQVVQTCLDPQLTFGSMPDVLVILWRLEDLGNTVDPNRLAEARDMLLDAVGRLRESFSGSIVLALPPRPRPFMIGMSGFSRPSGLDRLWYQTCELAAAAADNWKQVYTLDLEQLITTQGEADALDERKSFLYRQPYSEILYLGVATAVARLIRARRLEPKKCVVLDCDNTLWGGIIGEDGVSGIKLGQDFPGRAFRAFQQQIKALRDTGIFVALNSKNNLDDVLEVFDTHPEMILKRDDISSIQVNWDAKSENIKRVAEDLNIGVDSLVFIDDNPFEIEEVQTRFPELECLRVPEDVSELPGAFRALATLFDRLEITKDDLKRVDMMRAEVDRRDAARKLTPEDFLRSLELQVHVYPPDEADHARVVQLINKTNQFNLTTRRYDHEAFTAFLSDPANAVHCLTVRDKFGDYGLVGVSMIRVVDGVAEFENLLMSCRVLGRGVEAALLAAISGNMSERGAARLRGLYVPTRKNAMVSDLYSRLGFAPAVFSDGGAPHEDATAWELHLADPAGPPDFLTLRLDRPS